MVFNFESDWSSCSNWVMTSNNDFWFNEDSISWADPLVDWVNVVILVFSLSEVQILIINFNWSVQISDGHWLTSGLWLRCRSWSRGRFRSRFRLWLWFRGRLWHWLWLFWNLDVFQNSGSCVFIGGSSHNVGHISIEVTGGIWEFLDLHTVSNLLEVIILDVGSHNIEFISVLHSVKEVLFFCV